MTYIYTVRERQTDNDTDSQKKAARQITKYNTDSQRKTDKQTDR